MLLALRFLARPPHTAELGSQSLAPSLSLDPGNKNAIEIRLDIILNESDRAHVYFNIKSESKLSSPSVYFEG